MAHERGVNYDRAADCYDATRGWPPAVAGAIQAGLAALLAPFALTPRPLRAVEIGAGTGRALLLLAGTGAWSVGVDLSPGMLGQLVAKAARAEREVHAVVADAHHVPIRDAAMDVCLIVHLLHLVGEWPPVVDEAMRIVRPGGAVVLGLDVEDPSDAEWMNERRAVAVQHAGGTPATHADRPAITGLAVDRLRAGNYLITDTVLAQWEATDTPRAYLDRLRDRCFPAMWNLPEPILTAAIADLEADFGRHYPTLNAPLPRHRRFRVWVCRQPS